MKQLTIFILTTLVFWGLQACEKPGDNEPNTGTNPSTNKPDSVLLLSKVVGSGEPGTVLFEYDNEKRLNKVIKPFNYAGPINSYIFYQNGKISTIISEDNGDLHEKASAIFYYNTNSKCNKVVFKRSICCQANDNPYFHTVTNSYDVDSYDTLIYNSYGQLSQISKYTTSGSITHTVRFIYNSGSDTIPFRLEMTDVGGIVVLLINTSNLEHPALKQMWFFPFLAYTTYVAGTSFFVQLPILFDDKALEIDEYLSFFSKCVTSYGVSRNGQYTAGLGDIVYSYSADSLTFQGFIPNTWPAENAKFTFTKVKK